MTKSNRIPARHIAHLLSSALKDPNLPVPSPTEAFWQSPVSPLSNTQSKILPETTTFAIIGSGITGCSVAHNLLHNLSPDSTDTVTVFDARSLCSGATGRNGGHLLSPLPEEFRGIEKAIGKDEAVQIARFANRTLDSMHALGEGKDEGEVRKVRSVTGYRDEEAFKEAQASHRRYEECLDEWKGDHKVFTAQEATKEFNMKNNVGAITSVAGAFWPYRLVTSLFASLVEQYPDRFAIETNTPVTNVSYDKTSKVYTLKTPRGVVTATNVIYCSNAWTAHLLPSMRGKIFPLRGTMSVQAAGPSLPNYGSERSWSTIDKPIYNEDDETFCYGLYYITQNATTGDIFIGGEKQKIAELLSPDDSQISEVSKETLENILPTIYSKGWDEGTTPEVRKIWSGIMGFTPDQMPWVGKVPYREGGAEWIAAGFNGYGMPLCWGCGEAVAKLILGKEDEVKRWFPKSFLIEPKRLNSPTTSVEAGIALLLGQNLGWVTSAWLAGRFAAAWAWRKLSFGWLG